MKPAGGRFDEDTYERARKWRESQEAKASAPKPATPSKQRVSNPVSKKEMERTQDMRHMQDTIRTAERNATKAGTGSGRGGRGGPTADELSAYDRQQKDKRFEESVRANLRTSERDEMNKYRDRAIGAGAAAATLAAPMLGGALRGGSAAKKGGDALGALRDMTRGGPRARSRVTPTRPSRDAVRRSEEGFNPAEANRALARTRAAEAAKPATPKPAAKRRAAPKPKPQTPRKPDVSVAPARSSKSSDGARKRTRYNTDENNMAKGGKVKSRG